MIQEIEIRKGNRLFFPFINKNVEILGVNAYEAIDGSIYNKLSAKEGINLYCEPITVFKPIELSEEILLKCPQTKKDGDAIILMDRFRFVWKPQYKYWYVLTKDYFEYLTKIEFVHELQNFVYPLSGTELEINL